jgi:hypothetical protein
MNTLDTDEGQKKFAKRMLDLVKEFGGDCAAWIVSDKDAQPMAFGAAGTDTTGTRELLCRAISISYAYDRGVVGGAEIVNDRKVN